MSKEKICPDITLATDKEPRKCVRHECAFWQTVYTIEGIPTSGCIKNLGPQMTDGLLRV